MPSQLSDKFRKVRLGKKKPKKVAQIHLTRQDVKDVNTCSETDFVISVGEECFPVHKIVLSSNSEYFRALFDSGMQESQTNKMEVKGIPAHVPARVVQMAIAFMYGEIVRIPGEDIEEYIEIAELWLLSEFKGRIEEYIGQILTPQNCLSWFHGARMYSMKKVEKQARELFQKNLKELLNTEDFRDLESDDVKELFTGDVVGSVGCDDLLLACIKWIIAHEERKGYFGDLLQHLKLTTCNSEFLTLAVSICKQRLSKAEMILAAPYIKQDGSAIKSAGYSQKNTVILGGRVDQNNLNRQIYTLDLNAETIEETGTLPNALAKFYQVRCWTPQGIFYSGGSTSVHESESSSTKCACAIFDLTSGHVINFPAPPIALDGGRAKAIKNHVYAISGDPKNDKIWCLDMSAKQWGKCVPIQRGILSPVMCAVQDSLYIFSLVKSRAKVFCLKLQKYDTTRKTLSIKVLPKDIGDFIGNGSSAATSGTDIYIVGGVDQLCLRFDTRTEQWTKLAQPMTKHRYGSAACVDNAAKIMLCGGRGGDLDSRMIEVYDIDANAWDVSKALLPVALFGQLCFSA